MGAHGLYHHREQSNQGHYESSKLPLVIKEKDVEYQVINGSHGWMDVV